MEHFALKCIIKALTGYDCPFCGAQRSVWALLHGDLPEAFQYNPYIYIISPYIILLLLCSANIIPRESKLCKALYSKWSISSATLLTISWWIIRNLI